VSRSTIYTEDVAELFARLYPRATQVQLRDVAAAQDHEYHTRGGGITHGWMAYELACVHGLPEELARRAGAVLDALQPAIDLADNLADEELDKALGRAPERRYRKVPRESRPFLPALILGGCIADLHHRFPEPAWSTNAACASLLGVLARMNLAQGLPVDHPRRNAGLSGEVGRLWLLPFWLTPADHPVRAELPGLDAWVFAFGCTIQLGWDVVENPGDLKRVERLARARRAARRVWPRTAPFRNGGPFGAESLLAWPG
jgi:hypothetical protein